jgi:benzoylformate decarboxylase
MGITKKYLIKTSTNKTHKKKHSTMRTTQMITFDLLRNLGITIICGNPGSTEETFLKNFPKDFTYIMALQEASVVAIADGISQSIRKPVIVNVHTGVGIGNGMGNILTAYQNKTPLILTAGNQTRDMLLIEPLLTNIQPTLLPLPWVKWAYEPCRPEDVPGSFMRGYATAVQQPQGPIFLSIPLDDWNKHIPEFNNIRNVTHRIGPDPQKILEFADKINKSINPVLVYGSDIARSEAWYDGIELAEKINAPVWSAPFSERTAFPEDHPLYQGNLLSSIKQIYNQLAGHDLIIVIGAPVFRYYPYVADNYIHKNTILLHVCDDPTITSKAAVGDSMVCDAKLFINNIILKITENVRNTVVKQRLPPKIKKHYSESHTILPSAILMLIKQHFPDDFILTEECPSIVPFMQDIIRINKPDCFYTFSSGGLGWGLPASIGLAIGEKLINKNPRPVISLMGDGSFQYSLQALYTGVQQKAHVIYIVFQNHEYGILKQFAILEKTPNVPGLDLPGIDIVSLAKGYGARSILINDLKNLTHEFKKALDYQGVSVIVITITRGLEPLGV